MDRSLSQLMMDYLELERQRVRTLVALAEALRLATVDVVAAVDRDAGTQGRRDGGTKGGSPRPRKVIAAHAALTHDASRISPPSASSAESAVAPRPRRKRILSAREADAAAHAALSSARSSSASSVESVVAPGVLLCAACGESRDTDDRATPCPKCRATAWETLPEPRRVVA